MDSVAQLEENAAHRANEKVLFSPLAVTTRHPLQEGSAPSPQPSLASPTAVASGISPNRVSLSYSASIPVLPPAALSPTSAPSSDHSLSHVPANASVEEWSAALRIQSLYRGAKIRRSLRDSDTLTTQQRAAVNEAATAAAAYDENNEYVAVDPLLPADLSASSSSPAASADPAQIEKEWQELQKTVKKESEEDEEDSGEEVNLM